MGVRRGPRDPASHCHAGARGPDPLAAPHRWKGVQAVMNDTTTGSGTHLRGSNMQPMNRFEITRRLVAKLSHGEAVIGGIGNTNFDLWSCGNRPENFYMLGSMGLAIPIALGVALAQPHRRVIALEGDGSLLMQLGCLSTVAVRAPRNLTIV